MEKLQWHNEKRKIDDLIPTEDNPRKMTEKQKEDLQKSLEKFNLVEIPAINTDDRIISGHQRLKILQLLGRGKEEIDVRVPNRKLTEEEHREYLLRANKNLGDWDYDLLANFDEDILNEVGFESEELDKIFDLDSKDIDEVPEPPEEPKSKLGDLYQLGEHRLLCGDATKKEDVERLMDGKKADMVFTDPPFPNNSGIMHEMIIEMEDAFKNARSFCNHTMIWFWDNLQNAPFQEKINARHIWHKTNGWQAGHFEMMNEYRGNEERGECKVYSHPNVGVLKRKDVGGHLTPKPTALPAEILLEKTKANHLILDLFGGSGSTLIACEKTNRICYSMELDPKYVDVIISRWEKYTGNKAKRI